MILVLKGKKKGDGDIWYFRLVMQRSLLNENQLVNLLYENQLVFVHYLE